MSRIEATYEALTEFWAKSIRLEAANAKSEADNKELRAYVSNLLLSWRSGEAAPADTDTGLTMMAAAIMAGVLRADGLPNIPAEVRGAYLQKRGWMIHDRQTWIDPLNGAKAGAAFALETQTERDMQPFRHLLKELQ